VKSLPRRPLLIRLVAHVRLLSRLRSCRLTILGHHRSHLVVLMIWRHAREIHLLIQTWLLVWSSALGWPWRRLWLISTIISTSLPVHFRLLLVSTRSIWLPIWKVFHADHVLLLFCRSLSHRRWYSESIWLCLIHIIRIDYWLVNTKVVSASLRAYNSRWGYSHSPLIKHIVSIVIHETSISNLILSWWLRLSSWCLLLLCRLSNSRCVLLFPHLLIEMPVLLEPISVHSCPLSLHQPNNGIKLSLPSEVLIFLILIIVKPFSIVEENGFVIRPKVINELISAGVSLIRNLTLVY